MQDDYEKCLVCGERIPLHTRRCPHCGRELLDRSAWYNKYASNIVGAFLGAVFGPLLVFLFRLCEVVRANHVWTLVVGSALLGSVIGFFAWDRVRDGTDAVLSRTPRYWRRGF